MNTATQTVEIQDTKDTVKKVRKTILDTWFNPEVWPKFAAFRMHMRSMHPIKRYPLMWASAALAMWLGSYMWNCATYKLQHIEVANRNVDKSTVQGYFHGLYVSGAIAFKPAAEVQQGRNWIGIPYESFTVGEGTTAERFTHVGRDTMYRQYVSAVGR